VSPTPVEEEKKEEVRTRAEKNKSFSYIMRYAKM
jgi:hypothetical protein